MLRHEESVRLHHMLDAAEKAVLLSVGRSRDDLTYDDLYSLAEISDGRFPEPK